LLSDEDGSLVIIDSWDSQGEKIEFFLAENGSWGLDLTYAHDSESGVVTDFEAVIGEGEISIVKGSFVFTSDYYNKPRKITFQWNQMANLCEFKGIEFGSEHFTPNESKDFFETIVYEREED